MTQRDLFSQLHKKKSTEVLSYSYADSQFATIDCTGDNLLFTSLSCIRLEHVHLSGWA